MSFIYVNYIKEFIYCQYLASDISNSGDVVVLSEKLHPI